MTWRDLCNCVSRAASPGDAVVWAACMSAMLQPRCSAPSRLCALGCWMLEPMSVRARASTTVAPRAVVVACAVARGAGNRILTHIITSAAHAHTPWHRPRPRQEVSGRVKTVRKDDLIFHLCMGLRVWSAAGAQRCRDLPLAPQTPRVAYGNHRTALGSLPARSLPHAQGDCSAVSCVAYSDSALFRSRVAGALRPRVVA